MLARLTTPRMLVALAAAGSAAVLAAALVFQAFGFAPCELCIAQRWPHLVAAVLGGAIVLFRLPMRLAAFGAIAALIWASRSCAERLATGFEVQLSGPAIRWRSTSE